MKRRRRTTSIEHVENRRKKPMMMKIDRMMIIALLTGAVDGTRYGLLRLKQQQLSERKEAFAVASDANSLIDDDLKLAFRQLLNHEPAVMSMGEQKALYMSMMPPPEGPNSSTGPDDIIENIVGVAGPGPKITSEENISSPRGFSAGVIALISIAGALAAAVLASGLPSRSHHRAVGSGGP